MNENLVPKNEKSESLKGIDNLLNNFSSEIPEKMADEDKEIRFTEKYYRLKVRTGWFTSVFTTLYSVRKYFSEDFVKEIEDFFKEFKESHKEDSARTTKEEIDKADDLLKRAKEIIKKIN